MLFNLGAGDDGRAFLPCPYLGADVELSDERERHIRNHHPDLLPDHHERIIETVGDPDQIRRSVRVGNAKLFSKWYADLRGSKHVVVVVVSDPGRKTQPWIITSYLARKLKEGEIEWRKS
ncbi:MAG: hypothetical protein KKA28_09970 [Planctomycetes bacterium]|nr:hypothetical protein [Planctomycetota bacterium]MCG2684722.1 hypothetical protein [Planctomycetales bacterium]